MTTSHRRVVRQATAATTPDDPALRRPELVGANPAVQLFDSSGTCTAYASCWRVEWSIHGAGDAIVLWTPAEVEVHGADRSLGLWLADRFVRHFPELGGLPWREPRFHRTEVSLAIDLDRGMDAQADGLTVSASTILDRRAVATDDFPLGDGAHSLSLVYCPCAAASVHRREHAVTGSIRRSGTTGRPSSSAFISVAEVWRTSTPVPGSERPPA